jgi:general secretion pathway protein G
VYRVPGHAGEYEVFSYGRDGKAGGTGEDADIGFAGQAQEISLRK